MVIEMKFLNNILTVVVYMVAVLFILVSCLSNQLSYFENNTLPRNGLLGTVLATGKSDAIVITIDSETMIIDCGLEENGYDVLEYLRKCGISSVKYLLITHYDKDHLGGAATIIDNIEVENVIVPNYNNENESYLKFQTALNNKNIVPKFLIENFELYLGDGTVMLYPSLRESKYTKDSDDNKFSIVSIIRYGDKKLLFAGDAENERIAELIDSGIDLSCDFIKVPHHGNKAGSRSEALAIAAGAKYGVITDSAEENANQKVLDAYAKEGTKIFETKNGSVRFNCYTETEIIVTQNN